MITIYSLTIFRTCLWAIFLTILFCSSLPAFQYKNPDIKIKAKIAEKYDDNRIFVTEGKKEDFLTFMGGMCGFEMPGYQEFI